MTSTSLSFSSHWPELGHAATPNGKEVGSTVFISRSSIQLKADILLSKKKREVGMGVRGALRPRLGSWLTWGLIAKSMPSFCSWGNWGPVSWTLSKITQLCCLGIWTQNSFLYPVVLKFGHSSELPGGLVKANQNSWLSRYEIEPRTCNSNKLLSEADDAGLIIQFESQCSTGHSIWV